MHEFIRHDLVWLDPTNSLSELDANSVLNKNENVPGNIASYPKWNLAMPFIVTMQKGLIDKTRLSVAQCLGASKSTIYRRLACIPVSVIIKHSRPPLLKEVLFAPNIYKTMHQQHQKITQKTKLTVTEFRAAILQLIHELDQQGIKLRVYGSFLWQYFTPSIRYINPDSDLDILLDIQKHSQLKIIPEVLERLEKLIDRKLDGEICFGKEFFVAWQEWFNQEKNVMVKSNHKVNLVAKEEVVAQCLC